MQQTFSWECRPRFSYSYQKEWIGQMMTHPNLGRWKTSSEVSEASCLLNSRKTSCPSNETSCKYLWYHVGSNRRKLQNTRVSLMNSWKNSSICSQTVVHVHGLQSTKRQQLWFHAAAQHLTACDFTNSDAMSKAWWSKRRLRNQLFCLSGLFWPAPLLTFTHTLHPSALWFFLEISTCFYHLPSGYLT